MKIGKSVIYPLNINIERTKSGYTIVSQQDIYDYVFIVAKMKNDVCKQLLIAALVEYMRTINRHSLDIDSCLDILLVDLLVEEEMFYELHQYLEQNILRDSMSTVHILLTITDQYNAAYQLALDMLHRLKEYEVLLQLYIESKQIIKALKTISPKSPLYTSPSLKPSLFLKTALELSDKRQFYFAYQYFSQRNELLRGNKTFILADKCDFAVEYYNKVYNNRENINYDLIDDDKKNNIIEESKEVEEIPSRRKSSLMDTMKMIAEEQNE